MTITRTAVIVGGARDLAEVQAYLPGNYEAHIDEYGIIVITGTDSAGWTFYDYVQPRLASGLIFAEEVLS